jgi:hypothetical protein
MRFWVLSILLAAHLSFGQQTGPTSKAATSGRCSPAVSGSGNTFKIDCKINAEQGKQMLAILNKIVANQIDSVLVLAKLDEILAQKRQPNQTVNNGIGIMGGTVVNPQVNNFGHMRKVLTDAQLMQVSNLARRISYDADDRMSMFTCLMNSADSCALAAQLVSAFRDAGWVIDGSGYSQAALSSPLDSLLIKIHSSPDLNTSGPVVSNQGFPTGAFEMADLLRSFGISGGFVIDDTVPVGKFRILIGSRP